MSIKAEATKPAKCEPFLRSYERGTVNSRTSFSSTVEDISRHGSHRLGWCDVVARSPVFLTRDAVEAFLDDLFPPRKSKAPTHDEIMTDRKRMNRGVRIP